MDPVTQGVLGAVAAQAVLGPRAGHRVWIAGLAGGLLPDADVLLTPLADPALPWELHRHFTHAYLMAPVMGLLAGAVLLLLPGFRRRAGLTLGAAVLGALTHAPLDLSTSYGTKVYWPFSLENATLDLYPIIDPLLTLVLLLTLVFAARRRSRRPALVAVAFLVLYTGFALHQRSEALETQAALARSRGHVPVRARLMPLPASLLAWRSLYEVDGQVVADLIRPVPFGDTRVVAGGSAPLLREDDVLAGASDTERVRSVYRRFRTFADGWTAWLPGDRDAVGDMRFSVAAGFRPPWSLRLGRTPEEPAVSWQPRVFEHGDIQGLLSVILGTAEELTPAPELEDDAPLTLPAAFLGTWESTGTSGGLDGTSLPRKERRGRERIVIGAANTLLRQGPPVTRSIQPFTVRKGKTIFSSEPQWMILLQPGDQEFVLQLGPDDTLSMSENVYDGYGTSYRRVRE